MMAFSGAFLYDERKKTEEDFYEAVRKNFISEKKQGMTQEQLAEKMEVSRQAVSRWESGTTLPDASNIVQLSKIFAVSADYLLDEEYESETEIPPAKEAPAAAGGRGKKLPPSV